MYRKILVGLDDSEAARRALHHALDLAACCDAELYVVSVKKRGPTHAVIARNAEAGERFTSHSFLRMHHEARKLAGARRVTLHTDVVPGHVAQVLVHAARAGAFDLVIIGHTDHSRLHSLLLGSIGTRVVEHAPCAVLVVR
jgi:nucleotide-binding universal stress UspA family protein